LDAGGKARRKENTRETKTQMGGVLGCTLERWYGVMWTGLVWLRIGTGRELL
jgi:hypothetical protein